MPIPKPIIRLRGHRRWSRYRLAKEADISRTQMANIESGGNTRLDTFPKLLRALNVEEAVFGRDGDSYEVILKEHKAVRWKH
jgi:transcriptional regulator with XRE-family HTH domain